MEKKEAMPCMFEMVGSISEKLMWNFFPSWPVFSLVFANEKIGELVEISLWFCCLSSSNSVVASPKVKSNRCAL